MTTAATSSTATARPDTDRWDPGGIAAITQAATFLFGFAIYATVVADGAYGDLSLEASTHVAFLADNQVVLHLWYAVIYLVFGGALVIVAPALHDRLRDGAPWLARAATVFGLLWATLMFAVGMSAIVGGDMVLELSASDPDGAASLWLTVQLLIRGMGGGIELLGGLWMGLVSIAALRTRLLPRWLNIVGMLAGTAGIATTTMLATEMITSLYGAASIVWFTGLGIHLLRQGRS